jgi:hypothetical protein
MCRHYQELAKVFAHRPAAQAVALSARMAACRCDLPRTCSKKHTAGQNHPHKAAVRLPLVFAPSSIHRRLAKVFAHRPAAQ